MSPSPSKKDKKVKKLLKRLEGNDTSLNEIHVTGEYYKYLDDDVVTDISMAVRNNTIVKALTLTKCNIGSNGIVAIAESLLVNTSIEEVNLSYNESIGDEGIEEIATTALKSNSTITDLFLRSCDIGPIGALSLSHALQTNYTLTEINLAENDKIPEHTLSSIQRHLQNNSNPSKKTKKYQLSNDILHQSNLSSPNTLYYHYQSTNKQEQQQTSDLEQTSNETTNSPTTDDEKRCCSVEEMSIPTELDVLHTENNNRLMVHLDQRLGTGRFSQVYAATYSLPKKNNNDDADDDETINLACKFMNLKVKGFGSWDVYNIYHELDILHSMCLHENIVSVIGVSFAVNDILTNSSTTENSSNSLQISSSSSKDIKPLCILTEQATIGSLYSYLANADNSIDQTIAQSILYDISKGMFALHAHNPHPIFHQNLKSSNILLFHSDQTQCGILAKISDFGLPYALSHDCTPISIKNKSTTECSESSIHWRAPETFGKKSQYSEASDVWSFGMIMYEIATREIPFVGYTPSEVMYALCVENKVPDMTVPNFSFTDEFSVDLIESCWNRNPNERPRFGAIMRSFCQILKRSKGSFVSNGANSVDDRITIMTSMEHNMQRFNQYLLKCKEKQEEEWNKFNNMSIDELLEISKFFSMMYSDVPLQPDHFPFFEDVLSVAEICQVQFHTTLQRLVEESNGTYCRKPLKDRLFLDIEFRNMHNFDPRNVIDIIQGSGFFKSPPDLIHFLETLTTAPDVSIIQFIDNMNNPHPDGYRNLVLYVAILGRYGPKFVGEFKLHLSVLHDLKDLLFKSETDLDDSQSWRLCTDSSFQQNF